MLCFNFPSINRNATHITTVTSINKKYYYSSWAGNNSLIASDVIFAKKIIEVISILFIYQMDWLSISLLLNIFGSWKDKPSPWFLDKSYDCPPSENTYVYLYTIFHVISRYYEILKERLFDHSCKTCVLKDTHETSIKTPIRTFYFWVLYCITNEILSHMFWFMLSILRFYHSYTFISPNLFDYIKMLWGKFFKERNK